MRGDLVEIEGARVMRLSPPGTSREMVEDEARFTRLAMENGLEVPFVHGVEERDCRIGLIMDQVIGPNYLEWMLRTPLAWEKLSRFFAYEHHEMHMHQLPELPSLKSRLRESIGKATALEDFKFKALEALELLPEAEAICHGNYDPFNVIVSLDGPKVMDWSRASKGFYLGDVARTCLLLELSSLRSLELGLSDAAANMLEKLRAGYRFEYLKICAKGEEELQEWLLPVAMARLGESVPGEGEHLMRIIKDCLER
jgi:hypothetical protein